MDNCSAIDALINKLSEFNVLGKLADKTRTEQQYEFAIRAEKQILVAMREATKGCSQELDWIEHWPTRFEERCKLMEALREHIAKLSRSLPHSRRLQELKKRIDEHYLEMAAPKVKEEGE